MSSEGAAAFINARHVEAKKDDQLEAYGDVELRQSGQVVKAEHLLYGQESKDVLAEGAVRLEQPGLLVTGPLLRLNLDTDIGEMSLPKYEFSENHARGTAEVMHIESRQNYKFDDATYTTCPAGQDDWLLRMSRLDIDRTSGSGGIQGSANTLYTLDGLRAEQQSTFGFSGTQLWFHQHGRLRIDRAVLLEHR